MAFALFPADAGGSSGAQRSQKSSAAVGSWVATDAQLAKRGKNLTLGTAPPHQVGLSSKLPGAGEKNNPWLVQNSSQPPQWSAREKPTLRGRQPRASLRRSRGYDGQAKALRVKSFVSPANALRARNAPWETLANKGL